MNKPKPRKSGKYLLGQLQNLYCSCQSEFSAFLMFNYQSIIVKDKNLSLYFKVFTQTHLQNSRKLSEIIIKLNGLPFYVNSQNAPLSAFWLQPTTNKKVVLNQDKKFLDTLINNYNCVINICKKEEITNLLLTLKNKVKDELDFLNSLI